MNWIIKNLILNKKIDWILYGLFGLLLIADFITDTITNRNLIKLNIFLLALVIIILHKILNYLYRILYFSNQKILDSISGLLIKENYSQVLKKLKRIKLIKPQLINKIYWRGITKLYLKDNVGALNDFNLIENEFQDFIGFFFNKALALIHLGNYEESIKYLNQSIEIEKNCQSYDLRGIANMNLDKLDDAEKDLRKSIELCLTSTNSSNLSILLDKKGQHQEAIEFYNKSMELKSKE